MLSTPGFGDMATLAFVMAAGFIADTSSLPLVVSNLVNIVSADVFGVGFDRYAAVMIPVGLASILATLVLLMLWFRRDIPVSFDPGQLRGCAPIGSASRWRSPPPSSRLSYPRRSDRSVRSSSAPRSAQRSSTAPPRVRRGRSAGRRKIPASPPQLTSSAQDPLPRCQLETTRPDGTKQSFPHDHLGRSPRVGGGDPRTARLHSERPHGSNAYPVMCGEHGHDHLRQTAKGKDRIRPRLHCFAQAPMGTKWRGDKLTRWKTNRNAGGPPGTD